jgi:rod shape-determining protein MreC
MFSRRLLTIFCLILLFLINIIFLSVGAKHRHGNTFFDRMVMAAIAPFQDGVFQTIRFCENVWSHYFYLVSVKQENDTLQGLLAQANLEKGKYIELQRTCERIQKLLATKAALPHNLISAEVVGRDPSGWFKAIMINRGTDDGVAKGMPVISPEGIVGQVVTASYHYSKVMLMVDRSSAIDALVQDNRTRGIVAGETDETCRFKYVLRKAEVNVGDTVVSSGLDGLFPKGLRIGAVKEISKDEPGIFQDVQVEPFVDFTRLEEVLIILESSSDFSDVVP